LLDRVGAKNVQKKLDVVNPSVLRQEKEKQVKFLAEVLHR
jgi:uncharacterized protein YfkK (UPF0435 family)